MRAQADLVWQELFLRNAPVSEACRGVLTCFKAFGLGAEVKSKDLAAIRRWFDAQDPQQHMKNVFAMAGVRYAVMTNIPFDPEERAHWQSSRSHDAPELLRSALRIDPLFAWDTACSVVQAAGFSGDAAGAQQYLEHWAAVMAPEYLMASFNFALKFPDEEPFSAGWVLQHVVAPVARKLSLPFAIKCGTRRGANTRLRSAGDGVGPFDVGVLNRLCAMFPDVKFLATVLSMDNQHELAVTARKFANLHLYGCWWFCNNPSLIHSLTAMRLEMLGSAFTSQHSDSRVLEHLVYKWAHSAGALLARARAPPHRRPQAAPSSQRSSPSSSSRWRRRDGRSRAQKSAGACTSCLAAATRNSCQRDFPEPDATRLYCGTTKAANFGQRLLCTASSYQNKTSTLESCRCWSACTCKKH